MKKSTVCLALGLGFWLFLSAGCSREAVNEPSPVGPSTINRTFTLTANPNVLYASTSTLRPASEIKVVIREGNVPVKGAVVYFTIVSGPGYFSDYTPRMAVASDDGGVAAVSYLGPTRTEITEDQQVKIRAQLETKSPIEMIKDVNLSILLAPNPTERSID